MRALPAVLLLLAAPAALAQTQPSSEAAANPFFQEWKTPFGVPPFDHIKTEHFLPAIQEGMAQHKREVEAIAKNPAPPTFANTLEALDGAGLLLEKATAVFQNLSSAETSDALQAIQRQVAPMLAAHRDDILLDPALFAAGEGRLGRAGHAEPRPRPAEAAWRTAGRTSCAAARSCRRRARSACGRSTPSWPASP